MLEAIKYELNRKKGERSESEFIKMLEKEFAIKDIDTLSDTLGNGRPLQIEFLDGEFICSYKYSPSTEPPISFYSAFYIAVHNCSSREKELLFRVLNEINSLFNVTCLLDNISYVRTPKSHQYFSEYIPLFHNNIPKRIKHYGEDRAYFEEYVIILPLSKNRSNSNMTAFEDFKKFKAEIVNLKNKGYLNKIIDLVS